MRARLLSAALLLAATSSFAVEDAILRSEKRFSELERQLERLQRDNAALRRRLEVLSLPARQATEAYLEERGLSGVPVKDRDGKPLEGALRAVRLWGGLEVRYENRNNMSDLDYAAEDEGDLLLNRLRLGLGYDFNENITLALELRAAYLGGGLAGLNEPGVQHLEDIDGLYVHEAYVLFKDFNLLGRFGGHIPVSLQVGRQEMVYGDGFVMGRDEFGRGISYDGVRFIEAQEGHRLDLFWAKLTENDFQYDGGVITPTPSADADADLFGLYYSYIPVADTSLDAYVLHLWARGGAAPLPYGGFPEAALTTFGLRAAGGSAKRLTYSLEGAVQAGRWLSEDVRDAFGVAGRLGYEATGTAGAPWAEIVGVYSSGDEAVLDGRMNRFMPLAQDPHGRLGGLDMFLTSNLRSVGGRVGAKPLAELGLFTGFYGYYADETADSAGGWVPAGGSGNDLGWEWNVGLDWEVSPRARLGCLYGQFRPGAFTTLSDTARRFYLTLDVAF